MREDTCVNRLLFPVLVLVSVVGFKLGFHGKKSVAKFEALLRTTPIGFLMIVNGS